MCGCLPGQCCSRGCRWLLYREPAHPVWRMQKMIKLAQTVVVLADSSKFDRRGLGKIYNVDQVDYIVTDDEVSRDTVEKIEKSGTKVIIAE
jgi:DeoR/GlpR family transcriptional regulator of sugar metabolism